MNSAEIESIVQAILEEHFDVMPSPTMKNKTLDELNENFKILGFLLELEQLLQLRFNKEILLIEHISAAIHTPEDIIELIEVHY